MNEEPQHMPFPVSVQREGWAGDNAVPLDTVAFDASPIISEMSPAERDQFLEAVETGDWTQDHIFIRACELGLAENHGGPFTVDLDELRDWIEEHPGEFEALPFRPHAVLVPGLIADAPVDRRTAFDSMAPDGFVRSLIRTPFTRFREAVANNGSEQRMLDACVLQNPSYTDIPGCVNVLESSYTVVGLEEQEGQDQPDLIIEVSIRIQ